MQGGCAETACPSVGIGMRCFLLGLGFKLPGFSVGAQAIRKT